MAVVLVHGFGWTHREVAELTGSRPTTVQNYLGIVVGGQPNPVDSVLLRRNWALRALAGPKAAPPTSGF
jgi:hypothetical protein